MAHIDGALTPWKKCGLNSWFHSFVLFTIMWQHNLLLWLFPHITVAPTHLSRINAMAYLLGICFQGLLSQAWCELLFCFKLSEVLHAPPPWHLLAIYSWGGLVPPTPVFPGGPCWLGFLLRRQWCLMTDRNSCPWLLYCYVQPWVKQKPRGFPPWQRLPVRIVLRSSWLEHFCAFPSYP